MQCCASADEAAMIATAPAAMSCPPPMWLASVRVTIRVPGERMRLAHGRRSLWKRCRRDESGGEVILSGTLLRLSRPREESSSVMSRQKYGGQQPTWEWNSDYLRSEVLIGPHPRNSSIFF